MLFVWLAGTKCVPPVKWCGLLVKHPVLHVSGIGRAFSTKFQCGTSAVLSVSTKHYLMIAPGDLQQRLESLGGTTVTCKGALEAWQR